ncbi:hypothetical protein Tco_0591035 [Tanacetum coccineum]
MNRQLLDSQRLIPGMTLAQALTTIQTMVDHSQKWYDGTSNINIDSNSNSEGIAAIVSKLDNLGQDMKKLKENMHVIQAGCQNCGGAHLDKESPLNEEVKSIKEAKYGEFGRPLPFTEIEEWVKKLQVNAEINTRNQSASLKNLETQIDQLRKEFHTKAANEINNSSFDHRKEVCADKKTPHDNGQHEVSFDNCMQIVQVNVVSSKLLPCQLPPKEMNPGNFTLPCTIGSLNFYAMADLGASVNVIPKSMFKHLKLAQLKKTDMLVEMADMTKRSPIRIVKNVLVNIDKFLFPSDFVGKIQGHDPKENSQWKEDPQKDVERLESNLKTRFYP